MASIRSDKTKYKLTCNEIEIALAREFSYRRNKIVPNVSWGLDFNHELDMLVIYPSGWAYEIEIKTSLADLKQDKKKAHGHHSNRIRYLWFAVPESLAEKSLEHIPERAGLMAVGDQGFNLGRVRVVKPCSINKSARKLTEKEIQKALHLGCMRIWTLKGKLNRLQKKAIHRVK